MPPMRRVRRASAVTDGGRGGADGARSICYSGHGKRAPKKLADQAPWVLIAPAGPLLFPGRTIRPGTAIVPKYTGAMEAKNPAKWPFSPIKLGMRCLKTTCDRTLRTGRTGGAWYRDGGGGPRLPTGGRGADHAAARTAAGPAGRRRAGEGRGDCRPAQRGGAAGRARARRCRRQRAAPRAERARALHLNLHSRARCPGHWGGTGRTTGRGDPTPCSP